MAEYDYHLWNRTTLDDRDDYADDDPGVIDAGTMGRLGINTYSDGDDDDAELDCQMIHDRRNVRSLPSAPDPYFKRRSL